jgi:hypothetical protein
VCVSKKVLIYKWHLGLHYLAGFKTNLIDGGGSIKDFFLSNGRCATELENSSENSESQKRQETTDFTHMMPKGAEKMIRSVKIIH